jgi:D-alanine--poly(phosphoribitol) ligase subunit 2
MDHVLAVKQYVISEFMPDVQMDQLDNDYDLIASGVIDSLSLLRVITWMEAYFDIPVDEIEISEKNFTSVSAICELVDQGTRIRVPATAITTQGR